jgi:hypothetical protein
VESFRAPWGLTLAIIKYGNRGWVNSTSTGTATNGVSLGTALSGYQTVADAGIADTESFRYTIIDGANWEIGIGVFTSAGSTFTRAVSESSNSDNPISLSGTETIFISPAAEDMDRASTAEAEAGTDELKVMTPARTAEAIVALVPPEFTTGDIKATIKTTADSGWVMLDDGSIGSATSGATTRANADTEDLFLLLWTNISDTYAAVNGGRGASAAADWAANKRISLPKALGRALAASGSGSGLTARSLGQTTGTETHTLSTAEIPSHNHSYNDPGSPAFVVESGVSGLALNSPASANTGNAGGGGSHANMQPTVFVNFMVKL